MSVPASLRRRSPILITLIILAALVAAFVAFTGVWADVLWYDQTGYSTVLYTQWIAMAVVGAGAFLLMAVPLWLSVFLAHRLRPLSVRLSEGAERYRQAVEPMRKFIMYGGPPVIGLLAAVSASHQWPVVLQWLNQTPFGTTDPQFHFDIAFFVYDLPFYSLIVSQLEGALLVALLAGAVAGFLYGGVRIAAPREVLVARPFRVQIAILGSLYIAAQGAGIWLDQYRTLVEPSQGVLATGAGFTEATATIPAHQILAGVAAIVALFFLFTAATGRWKLPLVGAGMLVVASLVIGGVYPWIVQRFQVDPSARTLEADYITRNIDETRKAFGLDSVKVVNYNATTDVQPGALRADADTTAQIRIIDPALVTDAFAQLQQFRQYYTFPQHLDVDRYPIGGVAQDTVLAARELNLGGQNTSSWYNDHIVYTHGYGLVAAYGNQRTSDGQPQFLESGIPSTGLLGKFEPRIYFGEQSTDYSIVGAQGPKGALELDYPSAAAKNDSGNAMYSFNGNGGPALNSFFTRLVYAIHFQSEQFLLSDAITNDSQVLYDRHPLVRVNKVAPYLTLDNDPYPAVVNGRVVWIVDGYTTTDNYPYSTSVDMGKAIEDTYSANPAIQGGSVNYIRNSVKATVDAYTGKVTLYAWDAEDPLLTTWTKIFPATVEPRSAMNTELLGHVRYPSDLFKVQREVLGSYHVTDPGTFYSSEDTWVTPNDPESDPKAPTLQPAYYLTMQMPGETKPAFSLYSTFIPKATGSKSRNVLYGYLSANSDPGPNYGQLTMLELPKQTTVPGPGQVQAQFDSNATVGAALNLLRQGKTNVISGNLLTLPVGGGLLYVQPVYVRSTGDTSYPLLRKILVSFGNSIAFEDTLPQALDALFGGNSGAGDGSTPVTPTPPDGKPGATVPAALTAALQEARQALLDRQAAYANNDLVAAAQADKRLQDALQRAYDLSK